MVALGTAFFLEYLNDTVNTAEDVRKATSFNMLSSIGRLPNGENELVVMSQPRSALAESFRVLATNLRFASLDKPLCTLLVTSPQPEEGKSIVAANLAAALAQKELRVVLVDADLRLPRLHELFGFPRSRGLCNSLFTGNIDGYLQPTSVAQLRVLSGGHTPPNPTELVGSSRMRKMLDELAQEADLIVIDSPPVLPVADAAILATSVDGVLLVLRAGQTRGHAARQAVERLRQVNANLLGAVLNGVPNHVDGYYHYRYHGKDPGLERNREETNSSSPLERSISSITQRFKENRYESEWKEPNLKTRLSQILTRLTQKFNLPR
jgi:non-specific protein-tyrosine kinase